MHRAVADLHLGSNSFDRAQMMMLKGGLDHPVSAALALMWRGLGHPVPASLSHDPQQLSHHVLALVPFDDVAGGLDHPVSASLLMMSRGLDHPVSATLSNCLPLHPNLPHLLLSTFAEHSKMASMVLLTHFLQIGSSGQNSAIPQANQPLTVAVVAPVALVGLLLAGSFFSFSNFFSTTGNF